MYPEKMNTTSNERVTSKGFKFKLLTWFASRTYPYSFGNKQDVDRDPINT